MKKPNIFMCGYKASLPIRDKLFWRKNTYQWKICRDIMSVNFFSFILLFQENTKQKLL